MGRFVQALIVVTVAAMLAGCSSLGGIAPSSGSGAPRDLDLVADDLSALIFALDLPESVEAAEQGPLFAYAINDKAAPPYLETTLVLADADLVMGALPPPAAGHSYRVYALGDAARQKLRALQAFARAQAKRPSVTVNIVPRLCLPAPVSKSATTYSIRVVLPGRGALRPLIADERLDALEARSAVIPPCA
ncbi:MAG TPA: hypothetical protein GYA10_03690, partial [Alphaproteobacteria bacterium]|nr:hypothetical protein [Alphaproteobacteria bacterium]